MSVPAQVREGGRELAAGAVNLRKVYGKGEAEVVAVDDVSVDFYKGQFTSVMGPSGSGKSTLIHCLAALDTPSAGRVFFGGTELTGMRDGALTKLRRDRIGFIFQQFNLIPTLNAKENMLLPLSIAGRKPDQGWFDQVVSVLGLGDRLTHRPKELSGGQQQRVACARALLSRPEVIFADEPTGNLDSKSSAAVLDFLRKSVDELGQTIIMVTHDPSSAARTDRVIFLSDGRIVDDMAAPSSDVILRKMSSFEATSVKAQAAAAEERF